MKMYDDKIKMMGEPQNYEQSKKIGDPALNDLLCCPLCGGTKFTACEGTAAQATAIYCNACPYGVEDSTKTLEELRICHNRRAGRTKP